MPLPHAARRVALVGAGVIARTHAEVLKTLPGCRLAAVVDPDLEAARRLAGEGVASFPSVAALLAAGIAERAHVLVPPALHAAVARPLLAAGMPVLLEKPLAASAAECDALLAAAGDTPLGVNQNFVHHPAFVRLQQMVAGRALGRPRSLTCTYSMPLRQLQAQQFGHWMFAAPGNILLEQAVHPLSQIIALTGPIGETRTLAEPALALAPGIAFCPGVGVLLRGGALPATLSFAVGRAFPVWRLAVLCDDGVITADMQAGRVLCETSGRWLEAADTALSGLRSAGGLARDSIGNFAAYGRAMLGLGRRSDMFFRSMQASIAAFHAALDAGGAPALDGHFGAELVRLCETIRDQAFPPAPASVAPASVAPAAVASDTTPPDIAILGGTGFIGRCLVRRCLAAGRRVAVMARSIHALPEAFADPRVTLHRGSVTDADALARAVAGARVVINLAHGGGDGARMVASARLVADACRDAGVRRLLHVGSIAGLYLGPQPAAITGATPPEPPTARRAEYAAAKAACDRMLLARHAAEGLPVVILRPGVVVGAGSSPFHSGVGLFNTEQHCIGWNAGRNPLPFVLAEDVAAALLLAADAPGIEGRCYNLVGDVRPDARSYIAALAQALERPLRYHPQSATGLWLEDLGKWLIKRIAGRRVALPSRRDFRSRGMAARFDCSDARRDLGWQPEGDAAAFFARAVAVHAR